jgi:TctA family transporter
MIISDSGLAILMQRPISAVLTLAAIAAVVVPAARAIAARVRARRAAAVSCP